MVQKLNRIKVEEKLKSMGISVFSPREFRDIFIVSTNTASVFIKRNLQSGLFVKLRSGFYMLQDSNPSLYLIANKLYQPSYISLEKALSHYGIIPETVYLYFVDLKRVSLNDRIFLRTIAKKKLIEMVRLFNRSSMMKLINRMYDEQRKPRTIY